MTYVVFRERIYLGDKEILIYFEAIYFANLSRYSWLQMPFLHRAATHKAKPIYSFIRLDIITIIFGIRW